MLFSIDHGNSAIKTPNFVFTSALTDYPVKPPVETDMLQFGSTFWTLSGERIPYMRDKTKDERFFILRLFAIAKELRQREALQPMVEAELAIGLPPEHYELRNRFAEYFKRGTVQFKCESRVEQELGKSGSNAAKDMTKQARQGADQGGGLDVR